MRKEIPSTAADHNKSAAPALASAGQRQFKVRFHRICSASESALTFSPSLDAITSGAYFSIGAVESCGTTSTKQELAKRWGRLRCVEAQRLLSLLPSPDNAMRRAVALRDMGGLLFTGVDKRILVIRV
jgi:hypothetical protein